jgi:Fic family protein
MISAAEKISLILKISGRTQEKLAVELGVSFPTLNSWVNGKTQPRKKACARIDEYYRGVTGQPPSAATALEAKKQLIHDTCGQYDDILKHIIGNPDIYNRFLLEFTYNTNRIEGSTLTEDETAAVLFDNVNLSHKSLVELMEVKNHQAALLFVLEHIRTGNAFDEAFLLRTHAILMNGIRHDAGCYRQHAVRIVGSNVVTANYLKVPQLMRDFVLTLNGAATDTIEHAALMHSVFERVHPFSDGNGRVGRLLLQAMLLRQKNAPAIITQKNRRQYMHCLNLSQTKSDHTPLFEFISDAIIHGLRILQRR